MNAQLDMRYDDHLRALAEYANGIVQMELGNRKSAWAAFREAWDVYNRIGFDWRAGRVALRLFEMRRDDSWLARARHKLQNYSACWLGDELRKISDPSLPYVTRAQRRVLDLLVEGKTQKKSRGRPALARSQYRTT